MKWISHRPKVTRKKKISESTHEKYQIEGLEDLNIILFFLFLLGRHLVHWILCLFNFRTRLYKMLKVDNTPDNITRSKLRWSKRNLLHWWVMLEKRGHIWECSRKCSVPGQGNKQIKRSESSVNPITGALMFSFNMRLFIIANFERNYL